MASVNPGVCLCASLSEMSYEKKKRETHRDRDTVIEQEHEVQRWTGQW